MLNALRLREGFELARFAERTGLPLGAIERAAGARPSAGPVERDLSARLADARAASTS